MKIKSVLICILMVIVLLFSFGLRSNKRIVINFTIECGFYDNQVKVLFDNKLIYNRKHVITDETSGVAGSFKIISKGGLHKMLFIVDNNLKKYYTFNSDTCTNNTLYFGLQNLNNQLHINYYRNPPMYQ